MIEELEDLLESYFGIHAATVLEEFLREHNALNPRTLSLEERKNLAEEMIDVLFMPIVSLRKSEMIRARLYSILNIPLGTREGNQPKTSHRLWR